MGEPRGRCETPSPPPLPSLDSQRQNPQWPRKPAAPLEAGRNHAPDQPSVCMYLLTDSVPKADGAGSQRWQEGGTQVREPPPGAVALSMGPSYVTE